MKFLKAQWLKITVVLAFVALAGVMVPTVLATPIFQQDDPPAAPVPALPVRGGTNTGTCVVTETAAIGPIAPAVWTFIAGAKCTIFVPSGESALILARFSAESSCTGGSWCSARILIGGIEANPVVGTDFAFDSPGGEPANSWESHSMDRSRTVGAGSHVVEVQWGSVGGSLFRLDDWSLTVERTQRVP